MAGKLLICIIVTLALIQPFNTLPAADTPKGEYYTSDGILVSKDPIYWRPQNTNPVKELAVIVEPTITYTRHADFQSNQQVQSTSFKSSPSEKAAEFKPCDGCARSDGQVSYYPYYFRSSSSDRSDMEERRRTEERRRIEERNRVDASDPAYQRFVPRGREEGTYYYESRTVPREPTISSRSSVRFYHPNGTAVRWFFNQDNQQVIDIHPNQYVIQVNEATSTTTTTKRPEPTTQGSVYWRTDIDCPPFHPCNTVVYQPPNQCCKCYFVSNRCCSCNYSTTTARNK